MLPRNAVTGIMCYFVRRSAKRARRLDPMNRAVVTSTSHQLTSSNSLDTFDNLSDEEDDLSNGHVTGSATPRAVELVPLTGGRQSNL